jgi:hypothetical protein
MDDATASAYEGFMSATIDSLCTNGQPYDPHVFDDPRGVDSRRRIIIPKVSPPSSRPKPRAMPREKLPER